MQAMLQDYTQRNLPSVRRRAVQRLLDQGKNDEEIIIAFGERADLLQLLSSCREDPIKALKRDLADFAAANRDKSDTLLMLERQIRQVREQLQDHDLSTRDGTRLYEILHKLEREAHSSARNP
jgi:hypothetical protein